MSVQAAPSCFFLVKPGDRLRKGLAAKNNACYYKEYTTIQAESQTETAKFLPLLIAVVPGKMTPAGRFGGNARGTDGRESGKRSVSIDRNVFQDVPQELAVLVRERTERQTVFLVDQATYRKGGLDGDRVRLHEHALEETVELAVHD